MQQPILNFTQDDLGDWIAQLACGHQQHVRHTPPLRNRPWVLTAAGRQSFIGQVLACKHCDSAETNQQSKEI